MDETYNVYDEDDEYVYIECSLKEVRSLPNKLKKDVEVYDSKYRKWIVYEHSDYTYEGPIGFSSPQNPYAPINAISMYKQWLDKSIVMAVPPPGFDLKTVDQSLHELTEIRFYKNEKELLLAYLDELEEASVLSGWNSGGFDDPYVARRVEIVLGADHFKRLSFEGANIPMFRELFVKGAKQLRVDYSGRIQLDYLELFKKFEGGERASFKLESVAEDHLPHLKKLTYPGSLEQLYTNDFNHFLRYNIRDTEILKGFETKLTYIQLANDMIHSSTNQFNHIFGTVRMVDNAIVNYCHYEINRIVPDRWDTRDGKIQGAYVLFPQRGLHKWICSIDINSLYPSAIRAINISPETVIGQFENNIKDWTKIYEGIEDDITIKYDDGTYETKKTQEWVDYFAEQCWAVSGYGTVFTQKELGIIPSLLAKWYSQRKVYQAEMRKYVKEAEALKYDFSSGYAVERTDYDKDLYFEITEKSKYYNRLQYIFKIKLNSTYGCLSNYNFRFFRLELGESTTGTSRQILRHQCRQTNYIIDGEYYIDFPIYESMAIIDNINKETGKRLAEENSEFDFEEDDEDESSAVGESSLADLVDLEHKEYYHPGFVTHEMALDGPKFKGEFTSQVVVYGDSVAGDTVVYLTDRCLFIEDLMTSDIITKDGKEYCNLSGVKALTYDKTLDIECFSNIKYVMRHKCKKQMYRVWTSEYSYIDVTEDHSLMHYIEGNITEVKPYGLIGKLVCFTGGNDYTGCLSFNDKESALRQVHYMMLSGQHAAVKLEDEKYVVVAVNLEYEKTSEQKSFCVTDVYKIEKIAYNGYVYDIEVDDTHVFYANNILVHNTDSTYFTVPANNKEEAIAFADAVAEAVNQSYPAFMRKAFHCQPEYDLQVKCGREVVSDHGLFVEKKRYILHVVDNEGETVDKMKIMGLDIKKTTLPKIISSKLTDFIKRLLQGEEWKDIAIDIVNYKEALMSFDNLVDVGLPKNVNNLEKYDMVYRVDGVKARLPGNVAAAIHFNERLKEYDDHDTEMITSGMKIRVYYLKTKMLGKFTSIALPSDIEHIPDWFMENFVPQIDKTKQLSRLVDNPLQNILKAIDVAVPTAQTVHADELFNF
jgi:DNA polymerase elongation subunit (family B)